ncbi:helix-turn-helix transcriptional regulator [Luedemannella helvata]|uniref:LuxR family transcriptional regulator n=1 Tax=Luedemannella helvata TaxID=349315 RepID=A0ABP4W1P5_9ACTN
MPEPASMALHGRAAEWAAVASVLAAARDRAGAAVVLVGPVGTGKSALLAAAVAQARSDGFVVVSSTGSPNETDLPYAGLRRLLDGPATDGARDAEAALASLRDLGAKRPVLVVVDDVHHLDRPSVNALSYVARRLAGSAIGMVFAVDPDGADLLDRSVPRRTLPPLDAPAGRALLDDLVPGLAGDVADALLTVAGGNPLALSELARSLSPGQARGEEVPPVTLPPDSRVRAAYRRRLDRLPPAARWLTLLVAADEEISVHELAEAAGRAGLAPLDEAVAAGIVRVAGNRVLITDPLERQVAYHDAGLAERFAAHRILAQVTAGGANRLRHLMHRAAAAEGRDARLAGRLARAARAGPPVLSSAAFECVANLSRRPREAAKALVMAARQAWLGGQPSRARVLLHRARATDLPADVRGWAQALEGEIELRAGTTTRARNLLLSAASTLSRDGSELTLDTLILAGEAMTVAGHHADFIELANVVAALHLPGGRPEATFLQAYAHGQAASYSGDLTGAEAPLRQVIELAAQLSSPTASVRAAVAATLLGDPVRAHQLASQAIGQATSRGSAAVVPQALEIISFSEFAVGRNLMAAEVAVEGLRAARATGQESLANSFLATLAVLAAMDGDRATCHARLRQLRPTPVDGEMSQTEAFSRWALGIIELFDGHYQAGLEWLRPLMCDDDQMRGNTMIRIPATLALIEAATRCAEHQLARDKLYILDVWVERSRTAPWLALACRSHALVAADDAEAERYFEEALRQHLAAGSDHGLARTELLYGQHLRRVRRRGAAREHLRVALSTFEQLGATRLAVRARAELRAAGDRVEPAGPTGALTPQQQQIADLVAMGATNTEIAARLFLSRRTVEHHLGNIYQRLGIRSRVDLARYRKDEHRDP